MNSERKKWIESWLDSVSERGYQPAFVTALALSGYKVLHSTSHTSLEAGKDVIAQRRKGGAYLALQLKGNPGSRYTVGDWQNGLNQLIQLSTLPINPSIIGTSKPVPHVPVLVTNGEVHEDVHAQVRDFNDPDRLRRTGSKPLEIWARGTVLALLTEHVDAIWPTAIEAERNILKALSADGEDELDPRELETVVKATLVFEKKASVKVSSSRIWGAVLISSLIAGRWTSIGNYFEAIKIHALTLGHVYCYLERHSLDSRRHAEAVAVLRGQISSGLVTLGNHVASLEGMPLNEGSILDEFAFYHQRKMLLHGLLAVTCIWHQDVPLEGFEFKAARRIFENYRLFPFFDGEYVLPAALAVVWWLHRGTSTRFGDRLVTALLRSILHCNRQKSDLANIPLPHYGLADVVLSKYRLYLGRVFHRMDLDNFARRSQLALALLMLLVKRNWKQTVKLLWPSLTKFAIHETRLAESVEFSAWRSESAVSVTRLVEYPKTWQELCEQARYLPDPLLPFGFKSDLVCLLVLLIFMPHRMTESVALWLDRQLCETWY